MSSKKANSGLKFEIGEKIFVDHGVLWYEAKILEIEVQSKGFKSKVHYQGWNSRYDEWISGSKMLKWSEANAKKAKDMEANVSLSKRGRMIKSSDTKSEREASTSRPSTPASGDGQKRSSKTDTMSESGSDPAKRRKTTDQSKSEGSVDTPPPGQHVESPLQYKNRCNTSVQIRIPEDLKAVLVDDWDRIIRQFQLLRLPARLCVSAVLRDYVKAKQAAGNGGNRVYQLAEVVDGLKDYFNAMLGTQLLYKFERLQYADFLEQNKDALMAEYYGPVHLLRMFVKFGHMLAYTPLSEKQVELVLTHVNDLIRFLQKNKCNLFKPEDYETGSPEYQRSAFS